MLKKLGFIGAGKQAQAHAKAAVALGAEVDTVHIPDAAASPNTVKFAEAAGKKPGEMTKYCPKLNGILEADLDAIIVCAPWNVIPEMMPELRMCPLPMLIEKPITLNTMTSAFRRQMEIDAPHHTNKYVAMNRRFYGAVQTLKNRIAGNEIISVEAVWSDQVDELEERHPGITPHLLEMYSIHMLDLLYYLFGPLKIIDQGLTPRGMVDAHLIPKNPFPIHLSITQNNPQKSGITVRTKADGCLVLSPLEEFSIYRHVEVVDAGGFRRYLPQYQYQMREHERPDGSKPGITAQMNAFLNQEEGQLATIDDAVYIHNLINELRS